RALRGTMGGQHGPFKTPAALDRARYLPKSCGARNEPIGEAAKLGPKASYDTADDPVGYSVSEYRSGRLADRTGGHQVVWSRLPRRASARLALYPPAALRGAAMGQRAPAV